MFPSVITFIIVFMMLGFSFSPISFGIFYLLFRPLVQSFAIEHYTLVAGIPLTSVFAIVLIAYSVAVCIIRKDYKLIIPNVIFLYALLLFSVFSFVNTLDYMFSIGHLLKILTGVALYILIYNSIKTFDDAKKILFAIVFSSIIPMTIGYYQFFAATGGRAMGGMTNRVMGTLGLANAYGIFLALCICATLVILQFEKRKKVKLFFVSVFVSLIISTLLALNRGTWIALTLAILFSSLVYIRQIKIRWIVIAGVAITIVFSGLILSRFQQLEEKEHWQRTNTLEERVHLWKTALSLVPDHPVVGHGIGTAQLVTGKYKGVDAVPHNDYVRLLLEVGMPGLIFYLLFLAKVFLGSVKLLFNKEHWIINYPMLTCISYWIVISGIQNIIYHVVNFPLFLAFVAITYRWNELLKQRKATQI